MANGEQLRPGQGEQPEKKFVLTESQFRGLLDLGTAEPIVNNSLTSDEVQPEVDKITVESTVTQPITPVIHNKVDGWRKPLAILAGSAMILAGGGYGVSRIIDSAKNPSAISQELGSEQKATPSTAEAAGTPNPTVPTTEGQAPSTTPSTEGQKPAESNNADWLKNPYDSRGGIPDNGKQWYVDIAPDEFEVMTGGPATSLTNEETGQVINLDFPGGTNPDRGFVIVFRGSDRVHRWSVNGVWPGSNWHGSYRPGDTSIENAELLMEDRVNAMAEAPNGTSGQGVQIVDHIIVDSATGQVLESGSYTR